MPAWSSCIIRCRILCDPVRCTSTFTPGYAVSKSLATFSELVRASEVYQTTLPSFFAASTRASWAQAGAAAKKTASTDSTRSLRMGIPLGGERFHQGGEALQRVEAGHGLDDAGGPRLGDGEGGIAAELRLHLLPGHGQVGASARAILPLLEQPPVVEADGDVADELARVVDARIDLVRHSRGDLQHRLVPRRLVGELGESGAAFDEDDREQVGEAELRGIAVGRLVLRREGLPEAGQRSLRGATADLGDLLGLDLVPLAQPQRAVHVRLRDGAARVGLEGQLQELPGAPERAEQLVQTRGVVAAREGLVEAVGALEDRFRPREAGPREQRGHHTRMGGPARMQPLGPRAVRQVLDDPACLASADPE